MDARTPVLRSAERQGDLARIAWSDGFEAEFATAWLVDNAEPADDAIGGHRVRTARDLAKVAGLDAISVAGDDVTLAVPGEILVCPGPGLRAFAEGLAALKGPVARPWSKGAELARRPVTDFADYLARDEALAGVLSEVARFGLARLKNAGDETAAVDAAVTRFGYIRETNYGRRFEVRTLTAPDHLAYTNRALEPHTDNPYRNPVPTLQLLHCRRHAGQGGATFFVDGLALARDLQDQNPDAFQRLTTHQVPFAYRSARGEVFEARSPVIRLDAEGGISGLRFNHRALGTVDLGPKETALWYDAYLKFARAADEADRRLSLDLGPGDLVIFDNERLLHGRTEITGPADRLLEGCYADRDGLLATLARLTAPTAARPQSPSP
jgi:gamma-butyrobetaine dioxygenase